jgi:hypothetical protein
VKFSLEDSIRSAMAKVINIHQRELDAAFEQVGTLIDSLSSSDDAL